VTLGAVTVRGEFEIGTDGPAVILVGVDGSRSSMRAASYAGGMARRQGSRLVVLFVSHRPAGADLMAESSVATDQAQKAIADDLRGLAHAGAEYHGLDLEFVTGTGDPYAQLVEVAERVRAEMVVVGASESAGHRLVGSIAVRLVKTAKWPVVVVP
jgi:nucleotide-binding universal stress UspA family protein